MMIVDLIRLLIFLQRLIESLIEARAEKAAVADREELRAAIADAKRARTDEEKRDAIRRIQESFKVKP